MNSRIDTFKVKFLVTGNTGFKGAWLSLILKQSGHEVYGVALPPEEQSLFNLASITSDVDKQYFLDIKKQDQLKNIMRKVKPEVVIHFAAQPIVRESYRDPRRTIETNVMGTFNLLEALNLSENLKSTLIITSDKVYKNVEQLVGYYENDALGGYDPYSTSKAMADLLTQSWSNSYPGTPIQIIRAGNVIGGGDFGIDRLIPDIVKSIKSAHGVNIRFPQSVRPWQHVFDCLSGYLKILDYSLNAKQSDIWNIGPASDSVKSVSDILDEMSKYLKFRVNFEQDKSLHEAGLLILNSRKAEKELNWTNNIQFEKSIEITARWYVEWLNGNDMRIVTKKQIENNFTF